MPVIRTTHFEVAPEQVDEMLVRRRELLSEVRSSLPGLTETRLARIDERHWVDGWRWDSEACMRAALDAAPTLPVAEAAFALVGNVVAELAEIVDER